MEGEGTIFEMGVETKGQGGGGYGLQEMKE